MFECTTFDDGERVYGLQRRESQAKKRRLSAATPPDADANSMHPGGTRLFTTGVTSCRLLGYGFDLSRISPVAESRSVRRMLLDGRRRSRSYRADSPGRLR